MRLGSALLCLGLGALAAAPVAGAVPEAVVTVHVPPGASATALPDGATPLVDPRDAEALADRAAMRGRRAPDLTRWYAVPADSPAEGRALARALDAPAGQSAALQPPPPPPPRAACRQPLAETGWPAIPPSGRVPDLSQAEEHRSGFNLPPTADGAGVRVGDIEYSWRPSHEELRARRLPAPPSTDHEEHGTSVLAIIGGARDGQGTSGLAPAAELRPLSPLIDGSYNLPGAITRMAGGLSAGDVLLIEQQAWADSQQTRFGPVEIDPAVREAIAATTAAGIIVVEPAGNGVDGGDEGIDLDALGIPLEGEPGYSGAIMVGAGQSPVATGGGMDLGRESFSNYGRRVDVQGYGESVVTAGRARTGEVIGGPSPDRSYTACFNGTSSAAATVAGAVAAFQSLARARFGAPLDPRVVRRRLVQTGLPQRDPASGSIGPRPQIENALPPPPDPDAGAPTDPAPAAPTPAAPVPAPAPAVPIAPIATPPVPQTAAAPRTVAPAGGGSGGRTTVRTAALRLDPAARRLTARMSRGDRLELRFGGLPARATVRVGARRVPVVGGRAAVAVRPGVTLLVRVTAPRRGNVAYRPSVFRVRVDGAGAVRVTPLTSPTSRARL